MAFDLPSQDLATTLRALACQGGREILFADGEVRGRRSPAVHGSFTAEQALRRALSRGYRRRRSW
jgi:iron complex outermembrane recepter protein